jgi:hypothetical protein
MKYQTLSSITLGLALILSTPLAGRAQSENTQEPSISIPFKARVPASEAVNGQELIFRVFDQQTGGTQLFEERQTAHVADGSYLVLIGTQTPGGIPANILASHSTLWIEVSGGTTSSTSSTARTAFTLRRSASAQSNSANPSYYGDRYHNVSLCYTCGGYYPVYSGSIRVPSGYLPNELGEYCGGSYRDGGPYGNDTHPYLCSSY